MKVFRLGVLLALVLPLPAQELADLQKEVSDFKLPNGFHFTIAERHQAPVVAFNTYVVAGSVNDPAGQSGMARLMERLMFNGTESIGSKNWPAEKQAIENVETIYDAYEAARSRPFSNSLVVEALSAKLKNALEEADSLGQPEEWKAAISQNGGVRLSSSSSYYHTEYRYSLPSNRAELWFLLEAQHLQHPVFRGFYKERNALVEANKIAQNDFQARLMENFLAAAFEVSPYRNPVGGWATDLPQLRLSEAKAFFEKYYTPSNIEVGIAGDITAAEARRLAEKYFGPIPARTAPAGARTLEPAQPGPKTVFVSSNQPLVLVGYKRPSQYDKDDLVFDILGLVLANGNSGIVYRDMVEQKRMALNVETRATHPDGRYSNLFVFRMQPAPGHTGEEMTKELESVVAQFATAGEESPELTRAKARVRAAVLEQLETNEGLASLLPRYVADFGDWKRLVANIDGLNKVTVGDLQRVAGRYFGPQNRTQAIGEVR